MKLLKLILSVINDCNGILRIDFKVIIIVVVLILVLLMFGPSECAKIRGG